MAIKQTIVLLLGVIICTVIEDGFAYNTFGRVVTSGGGCDAHKCGYNAKCTLSEGRAVCSCNNLHMGDPLVRCHKVECIVNEDCSTNRACINNRCADACAGTCGTNALCETRNHVPVCYCPPGYAGDPFSRCEVEDPCKSAPCGLNTKCEVVNSVPVCSCLPGYIGQPLSGCRHECESDSECPQNKACSASFRCENPCKCGENANCDVVNHQGKCTCPPNWQGNPYISCRPECTYDSDCSRGKPVCYYSKCVNPCEGACGVNANCELRGTTPVCSCPKDMTGDPFLACRPFTPEDLCEPNPCGLNAKCTPGHDNTGKERPVCTCPTGYIGNALTKCDRGECFTDNECPNNKACIDYSCQNPCRGHECASSAICEPRNHIAVCTCPDGTRGDAVVTCNPIVGTRSRNYKLG